MRVLFIGANCNKSLPKQGMFHCYTGEHREFCEAPLPGYTGYVPRRREHDLGTRYATWTKDGFTDSLEMRNKQEGLATQAIDVTR